MRKVLKPILAVSLLTLAPFAGQVTAAAGHVDFATGGATLSRANGQQQPLAKGAELSSGDTIRTDAGGRAQIRFPDGAYVSLQPNTEFAIKEYNFDGKADGSERGFFALAKGAMRAVTGLIGRVNKNRYQIATPTATIGIRGTGGLISIQNDGSTLVTGTSGIWTISNAAGTIDVPAGTTGKAPAAPNQPPQQTTEKPSTGPTQPPTTQQPYTQGDQRSPDGSSASINPNPPLVSGPNYALGGNLDSCTSADCGVFGFTAIKSSAPVNSVFDPSGRLTQFTVSGTTYTLDAANGGTHGLNADGTEDFGTRDGVIAWGRWIGAVIENSSFPVTVNFAANQGLHYVVGTPTPVASLPTSGTFTFNLIGSTAPTYVGGGASPGKVDPSPSSTFLTANFLTGAVNLSLSVVDGNGVGYSGSASGSMNASVPGAIFTASGSATSATGCPNGCGLNAQGFFAGTGASHAGVSYAFTNTSQGPLTGAAALKR